MFLLTQLYLWIISDIWTTVITLLIGYVVYSVVKFYYRYLSLPPGPFPLPLVGNMLTFRSKPHWDDIIRQLAEKYGPIFTVYIGSTPQVIVTDADIARQAFSKNNFAGRPDSHFGTLLANGVAMTDYGPNWEARRRVAHAAAMKYSNNERLVTVAVDCMDKTVQTMLEREGPDTPINPSDYIYLTFLNILANSALNENYTIDDPEFIKIKYVLRDLLIESGSRFLLWQYSKLVQWLDYKMVGKVSREFDELRQLIVRKFQKHYTDYTPGIERDICDALITAKYDALREGRESAPYLTDERLGYTVFDMFFAGIETSYHTFLWLVLLLAYYPTEQNRLRQEIDSQIGERLPRHEDRQQCHYVMAFIAETMRFRNVLPLGLSHRAVVTSKIGDYTIPKGLPVLVYQGIVLRNTSNNNNNNNNNKYWTNGDQFLPNRFLDSNGHYMTTRSPAFIPFGVGRRKCLGDRLAIADLFLVLVRFLQSTHNYDIVLDSHHDLDASPQSSDAIIPYDYTIILKTK
ncbi:cytochrome P450 1A1-like [Oppia nitens]|uniref:cytochrome P450 1A1-like n=1 Tax=Oppia nitens TaxID=1686743 RepID=UPI0023DC181C|nr:cytochrome P450 1A1-like [Oppia nitens]